MVVAVLAGLLALAGARGGSAGAPGGPVITHGVVVGEVTSGSAVLWARADRAATLRVTLQGGPHRNPPPQRVTAADDFAGQSVLRGTATACASTAAPWSKARSARPRLRARPLP